MKALFVCMKTICTVFTILLFVIVCIFVSLQLSFVILVTCRDSMIRFDEIRKLISLFLSKGNSFVCKKMSDCREFAYCFGVIVSQLWQHFIRNERHQTRMQAIRSREKLFKRR